MSALRDEARALWSLAWPVLVGQVATVGMGVVDVMMSGHVSAGDLAAVSLGASVWSIVIVTLIGVMMAINTLVAHEVGAGTTARIAPLVRQALWMAVLCGGLALAATLAAAPVFAFLAIDAEVAAKATRFVQIISLGLPAFAAYRALYGYSASLNQTLPTMVIALGGLAFNIVSNALLVFGQFGMPRLGAVGCAVSTALGLWLMLAAMIWWIRRAPAYRSSDPFTRFEAPDWGAIRSMLRLGLPIGVTYFAEVTAFASIALLVARFGVETVAAHQIALNFSSLVFMVPLSFGIALVTRVGQALGAGETRQARFSAWSGVGMAVAYALCSALLIAFGREWIAAAYTPDATVRRIAAELLLLAAVFQLSDATQVAASCAIRGYKVTRRPMLIHLVAFWGASLPLGLWLGYAPARLGWPASPWGAHGFWVGLVVGLSVAALALLALLRSLANEQTPRHGD